MLVLRRRPLDRATNAIEARLGGPDAPAAQVSNLKGLGGERLIAATSMILHETCFDVPFGAPTMPEAVVSVEELRLAVEHNPPVLIDVCLENDMARASDMIRNATLHNPDVLDRWAAAPPRAEPIVVYCLFGFQISGDAAVELRRRGYDARALKGGISAWHAIGGPTAPLDRSTYEA